MRTSPKRGRYAPLKVQAALPVPAASSDEWIRWSVQVAPEVLTALKVRAAQESREIRETLAAAILAYVQTDLPTVRP
jgi:hypothetical protein